MSEQGEQGEHGGDGPETFYVTTPIYYPNDEPHIGHAYTSVAADVLARRHRQQGEDVHFLTGVDEHGQKIAQAAEARSMTPLQHVDDILPRWHALNDLLGLSNTDFIRTTEPRHTVRVKAFMQALYENGDLYKGSYSGAYCVRCEAYYTQEELVTDGLCPIHKLPVEVVEQENWFFRLSAYADRLLAHYDAHPDFIRPEGRRNEIRSFVAGGLTDISASRSAFDWGIDVPWEPGHVFYVWFDALLNYLTAVESDPQTARFWPAGVHLIGKDIIRFHCVYWPAMLLAAGKPLPKQVYAHGFLLVGGEKMGKSNATGIAPQTLVDAFGRDGFRYYFLREISFGQDGTFSWESMAERYTTDLANDLGNLCNRVLHMVGRYRDGLVPDAGTAADEGAEEEALRRDHATAVTGARGLAELEFKPAVEAIWVLVRGVNRYVEARAPWAQARAGDDAGLDRTLLTCVRALRVIAVLIAPVMPDAAQGIWERLGVPGSVDDARVPEGTDLERLPQGLRVDKGALLFPPLVDEAA
jgi:methionyl-tRNA synthetase